ncbi:hypothetical protein H1C71_027706, partial [Ictidomys tridecemlineatus]
LVFVFAIILIGIFLCYGIYCYINMVPVLMNSCFSYRPPITQMALQPIMDHSIDPIFKRGLQTTCPNIAPFVSLKKPERSSPPFLTAVRSSQIRGGNEARFKVR